MGSEMCIRDSNGADDNDTNGNGLSNFLDFAYGFDPVGVSSASNTLEIANPGANGTITQLGGLTFWPDPATGEVYMRYTRRTDYGSLGLVFTDQFSRDLGAFENATEVPPSLQRALGTAERRLKQYSSKCPSSCQTVEGRPDLAGTRSKFSLKSRSSFLLKSNPRLKTTFPKLSTKPI